MRVATQIVLTDEQRSELAAYARSRSMALRLVERANIILQAAEGKRDQEIAAALQLGRHTVARWRARFLQYGIRGIEKDAPRPGRTRTIDQEEIIRKTTQERPQRDPLDDANSGPCSRDQRGHCSTRVACTWTQASSSRYVQGQSRPTVCGET